MRIQKISILVLLFFIFICNRAGNNFSNTDFSNYFSGDSISLSTDTTVLYSPESVGMNSATLLRIDSIVNDGLNVSAFPGCRVLVMKDNKTVYNKSFGYYSYESKQKVQPSTMYDLASLSKTTGTLLAIMKLYDQGKLKLTDKASVYLAFLKGTDKENITITDLLFHETGLPAGLPFQNLAIEAKSTPSFMTTTNENPHYVTLNSTTSKYKEDLVSNVPSPEFTLQVSDSFYLHYRFHEAAMQMIANARVGNKTYLYSCINFIILKEIAETISGMPMDLFLDKEFFLPMKLRNIAYLPLRKHKMDEIAPTLKKDYLRKGVIQGYVHDPSAAFLGGVSGNAGLFSTAADVAAVYQMLLNNGEYEGMSYLCAETCEVFTTTVSASGRRGLGFDKPVPSKPNNNPCCNSAPQAVYGHTGYTGTCCWVDPVNKLIYVFLSNRTYPADGPNKLAAMSIRPKIQEVIYQSIKK